MRKIAMFATSVVLLAGPVLAADERPQSYYSIPASPPPAQTGNGAVYQPQSQQPQQGQNAQVPAAANVVPGYPVDPNPKTVDPMDPNMNPRDVTGHQ